MGKTEYLNLDTLVRNKVHSPRVDGNPLYLRVDGNLATGDSSSADRTDKWYKTANRCYTSPDNIKRVFITHKGVYVHLHQPIKGYKSTSLKMESKFKVDLIEVLNSMMSVGNEGIRYKLKGNGLSAITRPWVCSNIEEIYFDWSVLLSEDIMQGGYADIAIKCLQNHIAPPNSVVIELFNRFCRGSVKDTRARFPRLRAVGYIDNLDEVYQAAVDKPGRNSIDDLKNAWYDNGAILQYSSSQRVAVCILGKKGELITDRSIKSNIYQFDKDVLEEHFNSLENRIKNYYRSLRDNKQNIEDIESEQAAVNTTKSEIEKLIDEFYKKGGIVEAKKAIMLSLKDSTSSERDEVYNSFSDEGKVRYREIFNK